MRCWERVGRLPLPTRPATRRELVRGSLGAAAAGALAACGRDTAAPAARALPPAALEFHYHWSQNSPGA